MIDSVSTSVSHASSAPVRFRLSRAESLDLVEQVVSIASEGSPLASTLRLAAKEAGSKRLAGAYDAIATECERGQSLDTALDAAGVKVSPHIRAILSSGVEFGVLRSVAEEFLVHERRCEDLRRRTWPTLLYPFLLLLALFIWWVFAVEYIVAGIEQVFRDFDSQLPFLTERLLTSIHSTPKVSASLLALVALATAAIYLVGGKALLYGIWYDCPLVGPVWRFADLAEFSNMLATLLDRAIPLPQALEVTAQSVRSGAVGEGARQLSAKVAAGHSLASSLETTFPFSPIMSSIANWGERQSSLASAFRVAGVYYEQRQAYQSHLMVIAWPPIVLVLAASLIGYVVIGMMLPLTKLISDLS